MKTPNNLESEPKSAPVKQMLEKGPLSGISVPIAILLIGGLIIFGVTKMLSSGKDHRDLVMEMNSKTFGNRWIAAYELSKFLAAQKIPSQDIPWVIENLSSVFKNSQDPRTRNFIVLALGSLKNLLCLDTLNLALKDQDHQVKFNAMVSIGNLSLLKDDDWQKMQSQGLSFKQEKINNSVSPVFDMIDWETIITIARKTQDQGLKQAALLALASHSHPQITEIALLNLNSSNKSVRYTSAQSLIHEKNENVVKVLREILFLKTSESLRSVQANNSQSRGDAQNVISNNKRQQGLNDAQIEALKVNILEKIGKSDWKMLRPLVEEVERTDNNIKVSTKAKEVLKILKI